MPSAAASTPRPDPASRREQLLVHATKLFSERGYSGTSMRDLASAAGMQAASLYAHIAGKEDLLFEVLDQMCDRLLAGMAAIRESGDPPDAQLRSLFRFHLGAVAENLHAATVHFQEYRYLSDTRRRLIVEKRDVYDQAVVDILEEGIAAGLFGPLDTHLAAIQLLSVLNYAYQWFSPKGRLKAHEVGDLFVETFLRGLTAGGGPARRDAAGRQPSARRRGVVASPGAPALPNKRRK